MAIVPAQEASRAKIRRRLTLDLFTRYGTFWSDIADLRRTWHITPRTMVPPEPAFHAESVGLLTRYQMPERFHMPDTNQQALPGETVRQLHEVSEEYGIEGMDGMLASLREQHPRTRVGLFLQELKLMWRSEIPTDVRSGTNFLGWMSWTPFLSACVLYDPPRDLLLAFADHDDDNAAELSQATFWQDATIAQCGALELAAFIIGAGRIHQRTGHGRRSPGV